MLAFLHGKAFPFAVTVRSAACDSDTVWLIYTCAEDDDKLVDWIHCKTDNYASGAIQNEMVKVKALRAL